MTNKSLNEKDCQWQDIETAPRDGTVFQAKIPGYGDDNLIAWQWGLVDDNGEDVDALTFMNDKEPPPCWTDGWCWEVNEDGNQSIQPTHWRPPPPTQRNEP